MPMRDIYAQRQYTLLSLLSLFVSLTISTIPPKQSTFKYNETFSWMLHAVTSVAYKTPVIDIDRISEINRKLGGVNEVHLSRSHQISNLAIKIEDQLELDSLLKFLTSKYDLSKQEASSILASVIIYSREHNIEPDLILGLIRVESSFIPNAESNKGARGLMQVMPGIHKNLVLKEGGDIEDLWSPGFNIKIGTLILKQMLRYSNNDINDALARYNGSYGYDNGYADKVLNARTYFRKFNATLKTMS